MAERPTSKELSEAYFINDQIKAGKVTPSEATTMDMGKYKEVEESWKPTDIKMNGKDVHIFGALHTPATLEYHEQDLENGIKESSVIILEAAPGAIGMFNQEALNFYQDNLLLEGKRLSADDWKHYFANEQSINYYSKLELLAAKNNKPVAQIYAFPDSDQKLLPAATADAKSKEVPNLKIIATIISFISGDKIKYTGQEAQDENQQTERDWAYSDDYREAATTEALDTLTRKEETGSPVAVFFGDAHVDALVQYAQSSEKRQAKYPNLQKPKVQIFQFKPAGQWSEIEID